MYFYTNNYLQLPIRYFFFIKVNYLQMLNISISIENVFFSLD